MGMAPLDYGPVLLRRPFGSRLAADTLPSGCPCGRSATVGASPWLYPSFPTSCPQRVLHDCVPQPTRHYPRRLMRPSRCWASCQGVLSRTPIFAKAQLAYFAPNCFRSTVPFFPGFTAPEVRGLSVPLASCPRFPPPSAPPLLRLHSPSILPRPLHFLLFSH